MVRLTRIYTRGGDKGRTSLGDGTRVEKHDQRVEALGVVDEANAAIGLARLHLEGEVDAMLARIQNELFDLGGDLCIPKKEGDAESRALRMQESQVARLEREIDALNAELEPLDSFILPGGTPAAAWIHLARTMIRRAERAATRLAAVEEVNPAALRYLNRLSDHLFVLARWSNGKGAGDVLWKPGASR